MGWRCEVCLVTNDEDAKVCVCCEYAREQDNSVKTATSGPIFNMNINSSESCPLFTFGAPPSNELSNENNPSSIYNNNLINSVPQINNCELTPSTPLNTPLIQNLDMKKEEFLDDNNKDKYFDHFNKNYLEYKNYIKQKPEINENLDSNSKMPLGSVWVWGSGECDQLGLDESLLDDDLSLKNPTNIEKISSEYKIIDISSGALHNLVLTSDGKILSWGCNDDGALGRISNKFKDKLNEINNKNEDISDNDSNDESSEDNSDINESIDEKYPNIVEFQDYEDIKIKSIICGDCYSCCLTYKGEVYLWGSYKDSGGYIGFPNYETMCGSIKNFKQYLPVKLPMFGSTNLNPKKIKLSKNQSNTERADKIIGGENHTIVITENNRIFAWGSTEFGQFAVEPVDDKTLKTNYLYPTELTKESLGFANHFEIKDIYCGRATTFFVLKNNIRNCIEIYACGRNGRNELGIEFINNEEFNPIISKPRKVNIRDFELICSKCKSNQTVKNIGGGQYYSALLTCCGEVYVWGMRECCGLEIQIIGNEIKNRERDIKIPTKIDHLNEIKTLGFGADCCFATDINGLLYAWGMNLTGQIGIHDLNDIDTICNPYIMNPKVFDNNGVNNYVIKAMGGSQHSIALVWNGLYIDRESDEDENYLNIEEKRKLKRMNAQNFEKLQKIDSKESNELIDNLENLQPKNKINSKTNKNPTNVIKKISKENKTVTEKKSKIENKLKSGINLDSKVQKSKKVKNNSSFKDNTLIDKKINQSDSKEIDSNLKKNDISKKQTSRAKKNNENEKNLKENVPIKTSKNTKTKTSNELEINVAKVKGNKTVDKNKNQIKDKPKSKSKMNIGNMNKVEKVLKNKENKIEKEVKNESETKNVGKNKVDEKLKNEGKTKNNKKTENKDKSTSEKKTKTDGKIANENKTKPVDKIKNDKNNEDKVKTEKKSRNNQKITKGNKATEENKIIDEKKPKNENKTKNKDEIKTNKNKNQEKAKTENKTKTNNKIKANSKITNDSNKKENETKKTNKNLKKLEKNEKEDSKGEQRKKTKVNKTKN